jgi:hypothetical protein
MYRDLLELGQRIEQRIDERRAPYVAIAAGVVYLIGFNTVLRTLDVWYFGFVLLVAVLCMPFLFTAPASWSTTFLAMTRGFLKRNPRAAWLLFFVTYPLSGWALKARNLAIAISNKAREYWQQQTRPIQPEHRPDDRGLDR